MYTNLLVDPNTISDEQELIGALQLLYNSELNLSNEFVLASRIKLRSAAKRLGCFEDFCTLMDSYANTFDNRTASSFSFLSPEDQEIFDLCLNDCKLNRHGKIESTVGNFLAIMQRVPMFSTLRKNELTLRAEFTDSNGIIRNWDDSHDAEGRGRIEDICGVYSPSKYRDAFERFLLRNTYHPIKQVIESIRWDGVQRIPFLLSKWMGAENNEYTREVSRLIFAGGINRLYNPGCKFDDMPVLIGGQGAGKSTLVRWLAVEDRFFKELTTTDDKKGGELVEGSWIMEVSELLALARTKEQEEVKAFLSRQEDCFRAAYGRFVINRPRTCVFIGTSNKAQFIADKTGGRRFYPVHCKSTGYDLFDHEAECREYIKQCWAEARENMNSEYMAPHPKREVLDLIKNAQEEATEEDYREGMIKAYLDKHRDSLVCTVTLWREALGIENKEMTRSDQTNVGLIMAKFPEWVKKKRRQRTKYGQDRSWEYVGKDVVTYTTPNDYTPF